MRDSDLPLNCCGLGVSSHALRPHTTRMPAMQPQSVNTSVGSGDGDAVTDSFKDGVIPVSYTHLTLPTICSV